MTGKGSNVVRMTLPVIVLLVVLLLVSLGAGLAPGSTTASLGVPWGRASGALLGTDSLGRDVWSRTLAGGVRLVWASIPIGTITTLLGAGLGLGATRSARLDRALGFVTAATMAVPGSVVVLCCAVVLPSVWAVAAGMFVLGVPFSARIIRAAAGHVLDAEFLRVAERRGESAGYIVTCELLPAMSGTIIADAAIRILASLQLLAALHVLGFGPAPPTPDWAMMVRENLPGVALAPWSVAAPAIALAGVSVAVMLCLNALSRALAPSAGARGGRSRLELGVMGSSGELLRVRNLRLGPEDHPLLQVRELSLAPGQVLGIRGPSGAGKSSLVETLVGAPRPGLETRAEQFILDGRPLPSSERARTRLRRRVIGWSEQDPGRTIDGHRGVADVIADGRRDCIPAPELLERLGLPPALADRPAGRVSGGQAARISLARALAGMPRIIVLDEPTAGLDPGTVDVISAELDAFTAAGGGAIVVSHDIDWLTATATGIVEVRDGEVFSPDGAPEPSGTSSTTASAGRGEVLGQWTGLAVEVGGRPSLLPWDLELHAGEIVALLAPSGTGKSSVLRALGGDRLPSGVQVHGQGLPETGRVDPRRVQLMVQDSAAALNPGRSLHAQLARQARIIAGATRGQAAELAKDALAAVDLHGPVVLRRPGECSGGERQRAALARALLGSAPILLLDEPTSALDPLSRARAMRLLRQRADDGSGVLIATHDADVAAAADRSLSLPLPVEGE